MHKPSTLTGVKKHVLELLVRLGYTPLDVEQLDQYYKSNKSIFLDDVLCQQLRRLNRIYYKAQTYLYSEESIQTALQRIRAVRFIGLHKTNEEVYDLLTMGLAVEQRVEQDVKSFTLNYIDWHRWQRNAFHVAVDVSVERRRGSRKVVCDFILFVNGIPFVVIDCDSAVNEIFKPIERSISKQFESSIPHFFSYIQLVLAVNQREARYAAPGSSAPFWAVWKEQDNRYSHHSANTVINSRDQTLVGLCSPERLLDMCYRFTVFDAGVRKIARYQQYFSIKAILKRVSQRDEQGLRKGGLVWHTQGSGKSLTMVMLVRNLAFELSAFAPRIVLVTDREDLDRQLANTFVACGYSPHRATSGRNLLEYVAEQKTSIITTLIQKFDKALRVKSFHDQSKEIFMIIDESHRSNFGSFAARMRRMFPNACYLGFTGTPLLKREKNSFSRFGGLIKPFYSMRQAVHDGAITPLLYERRGQDISISKKELDHAFEDYARQFTANQVASLKKRYVNVDVLEQIDPLIFKRAADISQHFSRHWSGTGFKAQLVAPSKAAAIKYHHYFKEIDLVSSCVIISPPNECEGESVHDGSKALVRTFWNEMMQRYGSKEEYERQLVRDFRLARKPEILIVVSKLLTGFDVAKNTLLYLCAPLKEHTLLQAIARVNRLCEGKQYGYVIDYSGVLGELNKALTMYQALEDYRDVDVEGLFCSKNESCEQFQRAYEALTSYSQENDEYDVFVERFNEYGRGLHMAMSIRCLDEQQVSMHKSTFVKFSKMARTHIGQLKQNEFLKYDAVIEKLVERHLCVNETDDVYGQINFTELPPIERIREEPGQYQQSAEVDRAEEVIFEMKQCLKNNRLRRVLDCVEFSELIQNVVDAFQAKRISDGEYLSQMLALKKRMDELVLDTHPKRLSGEKANVVFEEVFLFLQQSQSQQEGLEELAVDIAVAVQEIVDRYWKVKFWDDLDTLKSVSNEIDDYLYDSVNASGPFFIQPEQMDELIRLSLSTLKKHFGGD